jgi:hypothetical protein
MPILVSCACGTQYSFKDELAGRRARCPACNREMHIPAPVIAEVMEEVAAIEPQKGGKGVLIFAICATGAVVVLAAVLLISHYTGESSTSTPSPAVTPTAVAKSVSADPPLVAPVPVKAITPPPPPTPLVKNTGPAVAPLPPMAPAALLLPFRNDGADFFTFAGASSDEENNKRHQSFRAARITTLGLWVDWLSTDPGAVPAVAYLKKPFPLDRLTTTFENRRPQEEKDTLDFTDVKPTRTIKITWLQYQDVGFAVDEQKSVVAVRITAWTAPKTTP